MCSLPTVIGSMVLPTTSTTLRGASPNRADSANICFNDPRARA